MSLSRYVFHLVDEGFRFIFILYQYKKKKTKNYIPQKFEPLIYDPNCYISGTYLLVTIRNAWLTM